MKNLGIAGWKNADGTPLDVPVGCGNAKKDSARRLNVDNNVPVTQQVIRTFTVRAATSKSSSVKGFRTRSGQSGTQVRNSLRNPSVIKPAGIKFRSISLIQSTQTLNNYLLTGHCRD